MKTKRELRGLVRASRKSLLEAEEKISQMSGFVKNQRDENLELYEENKDIRNRLDNVAEALKDIVFLSEATTYNNDKARLRKIKELAQDYLGMC